MKEYFMKNFKNTYLLSNQEPVFFVAQMGWWWWDELGDWDWHTYTNMYKIDN